MHKEEMLDLRPGDTVFGDDPSDAYEVEAFIRSGAFGLVYRIHKASNGFALKTIFTASLDTPEAQALFNEGQLATTIKHPNVIEYLFFHNGYRYPHLPPYIIMEYADGGDLGELIAEKQKAGEAFSVQELEGMFLQLAQGMQAINDKVIHRDVRPSNILLAQDMLKISDFGLSKVVGQATRTRTFKGIQHIAYMAPEAWRLETNTIQMDMYSMAIVFYELATLTHPYTVTHGGDPFEVWRQAHLLQVPRPPEAINSEVPSHLSQVIMKMIAKRPQDRYQSWDDIIRRIQSRSQQGMVDVERLVQKAIAAQYRRAIKTAELITAKRKEEERRAIVDFQVEELTKQVKAVVDQFNKTFDGAPLQLDIDNENRSLDRPLIAISGEGGKVSIFILGGLPFNLTFEGRPVFTWGYAITKEGKGFNLFLVPDTEADLYGLWWSLHNTHNPLAERRDTRPDPFPFERGPLPSDDIRSSVTSDGRYQMDASRFSIEHLLALLENII